MNKDLRQQLIAEQLQQQGKILVAHLAGQLEVTPETIRRDLDELELNKQLTRIHGGAVPFVPEQREMAFDKKMSICLEEKQRIARTAAQLIQDGDTIAVDSGTTTVHMADMIEDLRDITVVTNSLSAAYRFNAAIEEKRMTGNIIMLPGVTNPYQSCVKGTYTVQFLSRFNFNRAFISCGGISEEVIYDYDMDESLVSEVMVDLSKEAILLADSSKLNTLSPFEICPLARMSIVISELDKPADWQNSCFSWLKAE